MYSCKHSGEKNHIIIFSLKLWHNKAVRSVSLMTSFVGQGLRRPLNWAIFKTRNGEWGNGNGERGIFKMGNLKKRESLKWGIFKSGNL